MGFVCWVNDTNVSKDIKLFEKQLLKSLEHASDVLKKSNANTECTRWFDDDSGDFQKEIGKKCYAMRAFVNLNTISIRWSSMKEIKDKPTTYAAAQQPSGGWDDYTSLSKAYGVTFELRLAGIYRNLPKYCGTVATSEDGSKFQTVCHELSHLCLDTEDEISADGVKAYGGTRARGLATAHDPDAKTNAENWGFFIEEFLVRI